MDPYVPILSESDWDELRDTVIDIDVRDFQGMLLVCIGRLVDGTISAGSKVFANISEDNQERCSYLITRGYLVYEDAFTGILEPFIISRVRKSGGKLPFRTIGINDVVDPIIPCKFLAADIYHAGPNMRALGYRMLEYYRLCGSVRPDVVEMMAKIYETRALTKPPQSPKRHGAKYNVQPQKRISQEPSRQPEMTAREVIIIDDSDDNKSVKPEHNFQSEPTLLSRLRSSVRGRQATPGVALRQRVHMRNHLPRSLSGVGPLTTRDRQPVTPGRQLLPAPVMSDLGVTTPPNSPPTVENLGANGRPMSRVLRRHVDKARFVYSAHETLNDACQLITSEARVLSLLERGKVARLLAKVMGDVSAALEDL